MKFFFPELILCFLLVVTVPTYATQLDANQFTISISGSSLLSDNSKKTTVDTIDERQDIFQLGAKGNYANSLLAGVINYQLYAQKFAEHSQVDKEYADGSSSLVFGKENDSLGLALNHSRRMLLQSQEEISLLGNQQEREMISAVPIVRKKLSTVDELFL